MDTLFPPLPRKQLWCLSVSSFVCLYLMWLSYKKVRIFFFCWLKFRSYFLVARAHMEPDCIGHTVIDRYPNLGKHSSCDCTH